MTYGLIALAATAFFICVPSQAAAELAYVSNTGDNSLSVIDVEAATVTAVVALPTSPGNIASTPSGTLLYVASRGTGAEFEVIVLDAGNYAILARIPIDGRQTDLAVSPTGTYAYVTRSGEGAGPGALSVLEVATNRVVDTILLDGALAVGIAPDGATVYVVEGPSVVIIDALRRQVISRFSSTPCCFSRSTAVTDDSLFFLGQEFGAFVSFVDRATLALRGSRDLGDSATDIAVTPDGALAYVAGAPVFVLDTAARSIVTTVPIAGQRLAITRDGRSVIVTQSETSSVSILDVGTNSVLAELPVGEQPFDVATAAGVGGNHSGNGAGCSTFPTGTGSRCLLLSQFAALLYLVRMRYRASSW